MIARKFLVWGSELSPFTLKVLASARAAGIPARLLPADGRRLENLRAAGKVAAVRRGLRRLDYPPPDALAELPLVPYLITPRGRVLADSSAIAEWFDGESGDTAPKLVPAAGAVRFAARLIDEYFDEIGLYLAHHNRWVVSAATNDAGTRLANEFRTLVPRVVHTRFAERFSARQVRRLPYLFSVAAAEPERYDVPASRRPPGRVGFPPTHALLDSVFQRTLAHLEGVFRHQPFLLGEGFSVADASVYGCLGMNMSDPTIAATIQLGAPATAAWLARVGAKESELPAGIQDIRPCLQPLLAEIGATFVPLMRQNTSAYERHFATGERLFNEAAFDRGRSLYDGELCGQPFRAVAKTFQVRVWRDLRLEWDKLAPDQRSAFPFTVQ